MRGYLRSELVILVTHQLQFLEQADLIVIMDKGRISAMGTYSSMKRSGLDFAQLLTAPNKDAEDLDEIDGAGGDGLDLLNVPSLSRRGSKNSKPSTRNNSFTSLSSMAESMAQEASLQMQETRVEGKIGLGLYKEYLTSGSSWFMIFFMVFLCLATQILCSAADYFLSYW